jgi:hypothetical protein
VIKLTSTFAGSEVYVDFDKYTAPDDETILAKYQDVMLAAKEKMARRQLRVGKFLLTDNQVMAIPEAGFSLTAGTIETLEEKAWMRGRAVLASDLKVTVSFRDVSGEERSYEYTPQGQSALDIHDSPAVAALANRLIPAGQEKPRGAPRRLSIVATYFVPDQPQP